MKPAILITSHPNTDEKEQILQNFGNFISQYKIDHYLVTNYPPKSDTQKKFKGSFFYNNNPPGPFLGNVWINFPPIKKAHQQIIPNWTYSFMLLLLNGVKNLKNLGYTHFIYLGYDSLPDYDLIKNYIDKSLSILKNKKATFTKYELGWEDSLSSTNCASEIDFFIEVFENSLELYLKGELPRLCEQYWYSSLSPYLKQVQILSKSDAIPTTFDSASSNYKFKSGNYYLGFNKSSNNILIITDNLTLSIQDKNSNIIPHNFLSSNLYSEDFPKELTAYKLESIEDEEYYVDGELLFINNPEWRNLNYFEDL